MLLFAFLVLTALGAVVSTVAAVAQWRGRIAVVRWCMFGVVIVAGLLVIVSLEALDQVVTL